MSGVHILAIVFNVGCATITPTGVWTLSPTSKKHHPPEKNAWYEPLPNLGHLVTIEVNADELVVGIKKEESDNDSDMLDLDTDQFRL